jgi:hypothetical protein
VDPKVVFRMMISKRMIRAIGHRFKTLVRLTQ